METKTELLSCPFCRGEAKIKRVTGSINYRYVKCSSCGARTKEWFGVDVAVKTWNTRVYPPEVQAAVERDKPKKPDLKTENKMSFYVCESCGNKVFKGMNVCDECGQRLNWED
jgi:Lar family restriction alleviation protein